MKAVHNKQTGQTVKTVAFAIMMLAAAGASAAGFADDGKAMITQIRTGIYAVVGVVAGLCLLWQFVQGWGGRKQWTDILETSLWIVGAGAGIAMATWLFTKGGSMTF